MEDARSIKNAWHAKLKSELSSMVTLMEKNNYPENSPTKTTGLTKKKRSVNTSNSPVGMRSKSTKASNKKKSSSDFTRCEMVTQKSDDSP
jgi:hypothetical protein